MDGRSVSFIVHQPKSNQWVEIQKSGETTTTITRDFLPDYMRVGLMVNGVGALSLFKRRPSQNTSFLTEDDEAFFNNPKQKQNEN